MERHWLAHAVCGGVSVLLLYAGYLAFIQGMAWWHFRRGTLEEVRRAITWDPNNAAYSAALAQLEQAAPEGADVKEVVALLETATRLSPERAQYWAELGGAYEWAGREKDARRAYERAAALFPNSPQINWKLGNFYLRAGRVSEALSALRKFLAGGPDLRAAAFDLVWRAGVEPETILREMIPRDTLSLVAYLHYLCGSGHLEQATQIWEELLRRGEPLQPQLVFPYFDALMQQERTGEVKRAWESLLEQNGLPTARRGRDANLVFNGSFENEMLNGGLDWHVYLAQGVEVSVDTQTYFDGTRSLRLDFEGKQDLDYGQLFELVPVEPNTKYRFVAYFHTRGLLTDSGPRFQIFDAHEHSRLSVETPAVTGTENWAPHQVEFRTGPETRIVIVRLGRPPSRLFDNRLAGTLWIDRVSLTAAG